MSLAQALKAAYEKGFVDDKDELPECYGQKRRYESVYNCEDCPLNKCCEKSSSEELKR